MKKCKYETWAIIPARGGSKSIPLKNLARLNGRPLITYAIRAAKSAKTISRIICSTDSQKIAAVCAAHKIEVHKRPAYLSKDSSHVVDALIHLMRTTATKENNLPDAVALLQPTYPFILPEHIDTCVQCLVRDKRANSAQTITHFPHCFHAYNQRRIAKRYVSFEFAKERKQCYNKQKKPVFYIFGNLVVTKTSALLKYKDVFAPPSVPCHIPYTYAMDIDTKEDLRRAACLMKSRFLRHHN